MIESANVEERGLDLASKLLQYYVHHYDELVLIAVRMTKNYEDAEDVMQSVALALCKREKELAHVENCGAYIAVCIRRAAINFFRHKTRETITDPYFVEIYQERADAREGKKNNPEYDYMEWVESLESHLESYSQEMRSAFIAHYVDDVPLDKIAAKLGLSVRALSGRFARMRKTLKNNAHSMFDQFNVLILL